MKSMLLFLVLLSCHLFAQEKEKLPRLNKINWFSEGLDLKMNSVQKKIAIPSVLMVTGLSINSMTTKVKIQNRILPLFNGYKTTLDDYIQYTPAATMYAADLCKIPARNNIWNQSKYLIISELVTAGIVHLLKHTTKIARPNSTTLTSFPSGHTAQAFVTSQVLFNEYYRTRPLLGLSGYIFSGATGALRVINNRHWVPDVFMGAGIAILVTNLVYYFEPLKNWNPFKNLNSEAALMVLPALQNNMLGMNLTLVY